MNHGLHGLGLKYNLFYYIRIANDINPVFPCKVYILKLYTFEKCKEMIKHNVIET